MIPLEDGPPSSLPSLQRVMALSNLSQQQSRNREGWRRWDLGQVRGGAGRKSRNTTQAPNLPPAWAHLVALWLQADVCIPQWPRWTRNGSQPTRRASEGATGPVPLGVWLDFMVPAVWMICWGFQSTGPPAERTYPAAEKPPVAPAGLSIILEKQNNPPSPWTTLRVPLNTFDWLWKITYSHIFSRRLDFQ